MTFSPEAIEFLECIGWYPGRKLEAKKSRRSFLRTADFYMRLPFCFYRSSAIFPLILENSGSPGNTGGTQRELMCGLV